jgi:hypothetical protein
MTARPTELARRQNWLQQDEVYSGKAQIARQSIEALQFAH